LIVDIELTAGLRAGRFIQGSIAMAEARDNELRPILFVATNDDI
jgi:hypothetical protein